MASAGRPLFVCLQSFVSEHNWKNYPYGKGKKKVKKNQILWQNMLKEIPYYKDYLVLSANLIG